VAKLSTIGRIATPVREPARAIAFRRNWLGITLLFQAPPGLAFLECGADVRSSKCQPRPTSSVGARSSTSPSATSMRRTPFCGAAAWRCVIVRTSLRRMPDHALWMAVFEDGEGNTLALMQEKRR
jgi:hypothetical protein